jgi:lipopolysaccharide transport system ATP-binding protein
MSDYAIKVENLGKKYLLRHQAVGRRYVALRDVLAEKAKSLFRSLRSGAGTGDTVEEFWALKDVSFEIKAGEAVGIIGRNGAGKSTLLKILSRITEPTTGRVRLRGRVASLLEVGTGFHPELTGRENIYLNGAILGMHRAEIRSKFEEIVAFAEVERFLDTPVKRYSSGMYMRLAFAVAAHLEPEILIVDEVLAVGDADFQKKCLGKMGKVAQTGRTVLFVSHNLQAIRQMCQSVILLKQGRVSCIGDPHLGINLYLDQNAAAHAGATDLATHPRQRRPEVGRLLALKFMNDRGEQVARLNHTEDLIVEVRFRIDQPTDTLDIPMAIVHGDGLKIFSEAYSDRFKKLKLQVGEYAVQFSIPLRFLKLESYSLAVGLFDGPRYGDFIEGLPLPELINDEVDSHMETHRWGVVRFPVEWKPVITVAENVLNPYG